MKGGEEEAVIVALHFQLICHTAYLWDVALRNTFESGCLYVTQVPDVCHIANTSNANKLDIYFV